MTPLHVRNSESFLLRDIPIAEADAWHESAVEILAVGNRMVGLFPLDGGVPQCLLSVFVDNASSSIMLLAAGLRPGMLALRSLSNDFPQTRYFESVLAEEYGFHFSDNPVLHPVRKHPLSRPVDGRSVPIPREIEMHEVSVGPIHAGIIEPGHFAFQCHGEKVYNLEIGLGYQHRGLEKLLLQASDEQRVVLTESAAGDSVIGHSSAAHCILMESLASTQVTLHAQVLRCLCEELERIAMHLSGLAGIANDVGYALGSSSYGRLRTLAINALAELTGSRFGRGLNVYGGVRRTLTDGIHQRIRRNLLKIGGDIQVINEDLFSSSGILTRFSELGTISREEAQRLGITGLAARSSGLPLDTRVQFPYGAYRYYPSSLFTLKAGDVAARIRLRAMEIEDSLRLVLDLLDSVPAGPARVEAGSSAPDSGVIVLLEGWRGEIVHTALTTPNGTLQQYRIHDPSCINWTALPVALRGTSISDFPLCNKSFDLSYAGHDL